MGAIHRSFSGEAVHTPFRWVFANVAARAAATGVTSGDINKIALQVDDGSVWRLVDATPTWVQFGGPLGSAAWLDAGIAPNNVVQLTSEGKLPAVDGSLLTGIAAGAVVAAFFEPGSYTWTVPADGDYYLIGCGAGGGVCPVSGVNGGCGGGGGGAWGIARVALTKGASKSVVVGARGIGGATNNSGHTAGGVTSFGGTHTWGGGGVGGVNVGVGTRSAAGGAGGVLTGSFLLGGPGVAGGNVYADNQSQNILTVGDYGRCKSPLTFPPDDASRSSGGILTKAYHAMTCVAFGVGASPNGVWGSSIATGGDGTQGFLLILKKG